MISQTLKILFYPVAVIIILVLSACSANPSMSKSESYESMYEIATEEAEPAIEKAHYEFEKEQLSSLALKAFEQRAVQKILDFADYLSIVSDNSLDSVFLNQANEMLISLFHNDGVNVYIDYPKSPSSRPEKLQKFLSYFWSEASPKIQIEISDFKVQDSLKITGKKNYAGEIVCLLTIQNTGDGKAIISNGIYHASFEIESRKTIKQFGSNKKNIWEIFLGDIQLKSK